MATFKRVDGDYNIVSINPTDIVTLDTNQVTITGNLIVNGNASIGNVNLEDVTIDDITANTANIIGNITAGYYLGDGGALANISAAIAYANVVKQSPLANTRLSTPTASGNILVDINGVANVVQLGPQGIVSTGFIGPLTGDVVGSVVGDLFGSVLKEDSTVLVDANTETHYGTFVGDLAGNVAGDVTGSVVGDLFGSVLKEDSTVLVDANTETHYGFFVGPLTGNVVGNITGNITGNILGNIVGNVTGNVTGDIVGNVVGDLTGNVTGDVTGNISSVGDLGISAASDIVLAPSGNVVITNGTIGNVPSPVLAGDVASKLYVDTVASTGITIHTPVRLESPDSAGSFNAAYVQGGTTHTVTDIVTGNTLVMSSAHSLSTNDVLWFDNSFNGITGNLAYLVYSTPAANSVTLSTQYNGTEITGLTNGTGLTQPLRANSGVGATLTNTGALAALTIDGVTANINDRVLIYNQTNAYENGVYVVTVPGDAGNAWVLTRSTDTDTYAPEDTNALDAGDYFYVTSGNTGAGESYVMTAPVGPFIIGYTNLTFTQFSATQVYSAGTGLVLTGTTFSVDPVQSLTSVATTGNITASGNISANYFLGNGSQLTGVDATQIINGTSNVKVSTTDGNIAVTVSGVANVAVFTPAGLTLGTGNLVLGNINNGASNGVGNIGSSTTYFNTVFAKATSAQYADVAELYRADAYYAPGTVLQFGGAQEVTKCLIPDCSAVAGVVSEAPAYLMNSGLEHEHAVALALLGRVKCFVRGPVRKGDLLVSAGSGAARTNNQASVGTVIGKSLENANDDGLIEIVVGKH
jgi:hypothetical protein